MLLEARRLGEERRTVRGKSPKKSDDGAVIAPLVLLGLHLPPSYPFESVAQPKQRQLWRNFNFLLHIKPVFKCGTYNKTWLHIRKNAGLSENSRNAHFGNRDRPLLPFTITHLA